MARKSSLSAINARFDANPEHYVLTAVEFDRLCELARIPEKENAFFLIGLFIPCAIAVSNQSLQEGQVPPVSFFLNFIVAIISILLAIFQARSWYFKRKAFRNFVAQLQEKPQHSFSVANAGRANDFFIASAPQPVQSGKPGAVE